MEILPGIGVSGVELGMERAAITERLGQPMSTTEDSAIYVDGDLSLVLRFSAAGHLELIEIPCSDGANLTMRGVPVSCRPLDDVVAEVQATGLVGRPSDVGMDFSNGVAIWSMGSLALADVDPAASPDDERLVVEGISIGTPDYFGF